MRTAGIAELKARLSQYLDAVKAGEDLVITEHGRAVARIVPLRPEESSAERAQLVRAGVVRPAGKPMPRKFWSRPPPVKDARGAVRAALLEERRSGR